VISLITSGPQKSQVRGRYHEPITLHQVNTGDNVYVVGSPVALQPQYVMATVLKVTTRYFYIGTVKQFTHGMVNGTLRDGWSMQTAQGQMMLVTVADGTTYTDRLNRLILRSDLKVGDHVIVSGSLPTPQTPGGAYIAVTLFAQVQDISLPYPVNASSR